MVYALSEVSLDPVFAHMLLSEKWRPKTVRDCILPQSLKDKFQTFVDDEFIPHLLLVGPSGSGKTTVATAMCEELGIDYIIINASADGTIDVLRTRIGQFAATVSIDGKRKMVILDEADFLSHATQPALRRFMEENSANCGFIMTANYPNRILKELRGRTAEIDFKIPAAEKKAIAAAFFKRTIEILDIEGIKYDKQVIAHMVAKLMPNWRKLLNELQSLAASGPIDAGALTNLADEEWTKLYKLIKERNFTEVRKWVGEHSDIDSDAVFRRIYDELSPRLTDETVPMLILYIADYQYKAAHVANQEINLVAFFVEVMANVVFK
jgi:DNA polymerase III delta prime subunit